MELPMMLLTTRVKLFVSQEPETPIRGVKVVLFDRDENDEDDWLATENTDANGEIFFSFQSEQYTDTEDQPAWELDSLPDYYVMVYDSKDQLVISTREQTIPDKLVREISVPFSRELAQEHRLLDR